MRRRVFAVLAALSAAAAAEEAPPAGVCNTERAPATAPAERFAPRADGTLQDRRTGLIWRACPEGLRGPACREGEPLRLDWAAALRLPAALAARGEPGWRLPNVRELASLVELQCSRPALAPERFAGVGELPVWSASPYHFYTHYGWYVDFGEGAQTYDERIRAKGVWLVREAAP
ncbi:MAG: hypothetical protein KatS3mg121_1204 [Gammaproteobacteria bacterium]|nr:MAG: hypothetical protein KatS3mg121_1204 [Gammaproteobacteria bacterium]